MKSCINCTNYSPNEECERKDCKWKLYGELNKINDSLKGEKC